MFWKKLRKVMMNMLLNNAHGLLLKMVSFDTYFGLKLAYLIFAAGEQLSINLQAKSSYHSSGGNTWC